jgi:hypothetical protein
MRVLAQRFLPFAVIGLAVVLSDRAAAQSNPAPSDAQGNRLESAAVDALVSNATETPDEVTVHGQRNADELGKYRLKMTQARDKIVEVFNRVNSDNDNDVKCRAEKPTGSRLSHSVCRSKAEDSANAAAAKGMLDSLVLSTGNHVTNQAYVNPPGAVAASTVGVSSSRQEGVSAEQAARANLEAEMKTLMEQNRQLYRAVVEYVEAKDNYNKARGAGDVVFDENHPKPQ